MLEAIREEILTRREAHCDEKVILPGAGGELLTEGWQSRDIFEDDVYDRMEAPRSGGRWGTASPHC